VFHREEPLRRARVIGIGEENAGDDGVGLAVVRYLRERGVPAGVELLTIPEASALIPLLATPAPVVLVDAVLAAPPGAVFDLAPEALDPGRGSTSSHLLTIPQAIALTRALAGDAFATSLRIVAVTIERPRGYRWTLSPAVAAVIPGAAARVLALLEGGAG
jgi:hydrogenase maturation protease